MKLYDMLKLNNKVINVTQLEEVLESKYCTWCERTDKGIYDGHVCYEIILYAPLSDFESTKIKLYL